MSSPRQGRKQTQVAWEDCEAWIEQLYEEFHARVDLSVSLLPRSWKLCSAVSAVVYLQGIGKEKRILWESWEKFTPSVVGGAESAAIKLVSRALLELSDRSEEVAEQAALLLA